MEDTEKLQTHIPENQRIIDFLYRCMDATDNRHKKDAYRRAISIVYSYWSVIDAPPQNIGPSIARKIREFLEGFPEDDIIDS
jgi:DNA polymerase/3'-5' exonuclease PolX